MSGPELIATFVSFGLWTAITYWLAWEKGSKHQRAETCARESRIEEMRKDKHRLEDCVSGYKLALRMIATPCEGEENYEPRTIAKTALRARGDG